eukprot:gene3014-1996_t
MRSFTYILLLVWRLLPVDEFLECCVHFYSYGDVHTFCADVFVVCGFLYYEGFVMYLTTLIFYVNGCVFVCIRICVGFEVFMVLQFLHLVSFKFEAVRGRDLLLTLVYCEISNSCDTFVFVGVITVMIFKIL